MKKIPYAQLIIGLDQLFFGKMGSESVEARAEAIERYLSSNGWTWEEYHKVNPFDEAEGIQSKFHN